MATAKERQVWRELFGDEAFAKAWENYRLEVQSIGTVPHGDAAAAICRASEDIFTLPEARPDLAVLAKSVEPGDD